MYERKSSRRSKRTEIKCEVAIVGGGMAGSYLAMTLAKEYKRRLCLFDKDKYTGGRFQDIPVNPDDKNSAKVGIGGRRILTSQHVMMNLAKELNIELQKANNSDASIPEELCFARGEHHFTTNSGDKDVFAELYDTLPIDLKQTDYEYQLIKTLFSSPERKNIVNYPSLRSYVESTVGHAGFKYLLDMTRFKSDYLYSLSAQDWVDWLENEYTYDYDPRYPVGGMSTYIKTMLSRATESGARIFKPEKISKINTDGYGGYRLSSRKKKVNANKIILAVPAQALSKIEGDVVDDIVSQDPFKYIVGVRVMTVTQWYEDAWWMDIKRISNNRTAWRAWTSDSCIQAIEIPQEPYLLGKKAFRVVYADEPECLEYFDFLKTHNHAKLEEEIRNGLRHLFENNGITTPVEVPWATRTVVKDWPDAWYWIKSGSPYSSRYVANWASAPLKGKNVGMASESYFSHRSTWSEAAILSADQLLRRQYFDIINKPSGNRFASGKSLMDYSYETIHPSETLHDSTISKDVTKEAKEMDRKLTMDRQLRENEQTKKEK